MKRYRVEVIVIDNDDYGNETEVGEYATDALEEGLGKDFIVEDLSVYEVML